MPEELARYADIPGYAFVLFFLGVAWFVVDKIIPAVRKAINPDYSQRVADRGGQHSIDECRVAIAELKADMEKGFREARQEREERNHRVWQELHTVAAKINNIEGYLRGKAGEPFSGTGAD